MHACMYVYMYTLIGRQVSAPQFSAPRTAKYLQIAASSLGPGSDGSFPWPPKHQDPVDHLQTAGA